MLIENVKINLIWIQELPQIWISKNLDFTLKLGLIIFLSFIEHLTSMQAPLVNVFNTLVNKIICDWGREINNKNVG